MCTNFESNWEKKKYSENSIPSSEMVTIDAYNVVCQRIGKDYRNKLVKFLIVFW